MSANVLLLVDYQSGSANLNFFKVSAEGQEQIIIGCCSFQSPESAHQTLLALPKLLTVPTAAPALKNKAVGHGAVSPQRR